MSPLGANSYQHCSLCSTAAAQLIHCASCAVIQTRGGAYRRHRQATHLLSCRHTPSVCCRCMSPLGTNSYQHCSLCSTAAAQLIYCASCAVIQTRGGAYRRHRQATHLLSCRHTPLVCCRCMSPHGANSYQHCSCNSITAILSSGCHSSAHSHGHYK